MRLSPWQRSVSVWRHPANRGRRCRAWAAGVAWLAYRTLFSTPRLRRGPGGFVYRAWPDNGFSKRMILYGGLPDYAEMRFLLDYLRPGDEFLDVGANIGIYSLLAATVVGGAGRVEALEPGHRAGTRLRQNIDLNDFDQITLRQVAASSTDGEGLLLSNQDVGNRLKTAVDRGIRSRRVPTVRLDTLFEGRRFALGKIDIEGAEPLAFAGAPSLLAAASPPVWILELNGKLRDYGHTEEGFAAWLYERGYELALYDPGERRLRGGERLWTSLSREPGAANLLAVHRSRRDKVAARARGGP